MAATLSELLGQQNTAPQTGGISTLAPQLGAAPVAPQQDPLAQIKQAGLDEALYNAYKNDKGMRYEVGKFQATPEYWNKADQYYNVTGLSADKRNNDKYYTIGKLYDELKNSGVNWTNTTGNYDAYTAAMNLTNQGVRTLSDLKYGPDGKSIINADTGQPIKLRDPKKNQLWFSAKGKGHTDYNFKKDANGNPVLVPKWKTSTTNLGLLGKIAPIAASFIPGIGAIAAPLVSGLVSAVQGGSPLSILKNAGLGYLGGQLANGITGSLPTTGMTGLDKVLSGATSGAIKGGLLTGNPLQGALTGGLGGLAGSAASGLSSGLSSSTGLPSYLTDAITKAGTNYLTSGGNTLSALSGFGSGLLSGSGGLQGIGGKVSNSLIPGGDPQLEEGFFDGGAGGSNMGDYETAPSDWWAQEEALAGDQAPSDWWAQEEANANPTVDSDSYWLNETGQATPGDEQPGSTNVYPSGATNPNTSGLVSALSKLVSSGQASPEISKLLAALLGAGAGYLGRTKAVKPSGGGVGYAMPNAAPLTRTIVRDPKTGGPLARYAAAGGRIDGYAAGGGIGQLSQGRFLRGPGDGVSDSIPAHINGEQPAALADGEYVIPARIVSEMGNGSSEAGSRKLDEMIKRIQATRRNTADVAADTNAARYQPV